MKCATVDGLENPGGVEFPSRTQIELSGHLRWHSFPFWVKSRTSCVRHCNISFARDVNNYDASMDLGTTA